MKKSIIASAILATIAFAPTGASANYYGYERCMNNGGNWFTCLGELADVTADGADVDAEFGFARNLDKKQVQASIKELSKTCDTKTGSDRMSCYSKGLKAKAGGMTVAKPAMKAPGLKEGKAPAMKMQAPEKKAAPLK